LTRLRLATYSELKTVTEMNGFNWVRCEGSHNTFRNAEGRIIVIPDHGSQVIVRSLIRKIIRDMGISIDEYHNNLNSL